MNQPLPLSNEQLLHVLMSSKDATAIHYSEKAIIQYANDAMIAFWGKGRGVIGKSLEDALPEHVEAGCNVLLQAMLSAARV